MTYSVMLMRAGRIRLVGILCILIPILTLTFISASIYVARNWFILTRHALSNLGATEVESYIIFNSGLIIIGVLSMAASVLIILESWSTNRLRIIPTALLLITSIFLIGIGLFPMDATPEAHWTSAVLFFVLIGFTMLGFGLYYLYYREVLLGILGILGLVIDFVVWGIAPWESFGITGVAIPEILSVLVPMIWLIIFALKILRTGKIP